MSNTKAGKKKESVQVDFHLQNWIWRKGEYFNEMHGLGLDGISQVGPDLHVVWGFGDAYEEYADMREAMFAARGIKVVDTAYNSQPEFWAELISGASYVALVSTLKAAQNACQDEDYEVAYDPDADDE